MPILIPTRTMPLLPLPTTTNKMSSPTGTEINFAQIITIVITVAVTGVGALIAWTNRINKAEGKQSVTTTVIENAIAKLEELRKDMEALRKAIQAEEVKKAVLEQRMDYIEKQMEQLGRKLEETRSDRWQRDSLDRRDQQDKDRGWKGGSSSR